MKRPSSDIYVIFFGLVSIFNYFIIIIIFKPTCTCTCTLDTTLDTHFGLRAFANCNHFPFLFFLGQNVPSFQFHIIITEVYKSVKLTPQVNSRFVFL